MIHPASFDRPGAGLRPGLSCRCPAPFSSRFAFGLALLTLTASHLPAQTFDLTTYTLNTANFGDYFTVNFTGGDETHPTDADGFHFFAGSTPDNDTVDLSLTGFSLPFDEAWQLTFNVLMEAPANVPTLPGGDYLGLDITATTGTNPFLLYYSFANNSFSYPTTQFGHQVNFFSAEETTGASATREFSTLPTGRNLAVTFTNTSNGDRYGLITATATWDGQQPGDTFSASFDFLGAESTWGLDPTDTLSFDLNFYSINVPNVELGLVSVAHGIAVSAVPEPSTYAAIAGVLAFAGAAWRRRGSAVAPAA